MTLSSFPFKIPVLLPLSVDHPFDYEHKENLAPGTLVKVPFRNRELYGIVWDSPAPPPTSDAIAYKAILTAFKSPLLPSVSLKFIEWVNAYTLIPRGQLLKMVLPFPEVVEKEAKDLEKSKSKPQKPVLSSDQLEAANRLIQSLKSETFSPFLLEGVTGSGKTEVYFEVIAATLEQGKQSLVLLPEIALSTQWLQRFERRFGFCPAVWHSDLTPRERKATFKALLDGKVPVLVGARSALFLPFRDLSLIIVDEEHDGSYKQEEGGIYNARDMALVRARLSQGVCVLVSATPSLETESNVRGGKYQHIHLNSRYGGAQMPTVVLVDMRKITLPSNTWLSPFLRQELEKTLSQGEQAMLFLNRRGYAPLTLCHACGDRLMCPDCSISLVHHKSSNKLMCHHCGYTQYEPLKCPACQAENSYRAIGPGVERIHEEVEKFLPQARSILLTSDHLNTPKKMLEAIHKIQNHEVDILIGTQIMAKGHHFPLLTLVGIVDGDSALSGSDLRAAEKAFQLLHQVAGRSGREEKKGQVLLQTYLPEHPLMQALVHQDRTEFFTAESQERRLHGFPPYGRLVALILTGRKAEEVEKAARFLAHKFPQAPSVELLGPTPAPLSYLRGRYRWRLLLKTPKEMAPQALLKDWLGKIRLPHSLKLHLDIDPYSFL